MIESIPADWRAVLVDDLADPSTARLAAFVAGERAERRAAVYPPVDDVLAALRLTPFEAVRAVILGQDPYHQPDRAHGLAFSVPPGVPLPGSLRNILVEWAHDPRLPDPYQRLAGPVGPARRAPAQHGADGPPRLSRQP